MNLKPYLLFVVWCCFSTSTFGFDEFMYCARVTRTQRAMLEKIPCDLSKETYCSEPGDLYPWRSMRQYMQENRGTMKRMYGEARQLNILKSEFIDTVDYNNGFLENTFFYDDDALYRYRKRPTFKPPVTEELTSAVPKTEATTKSSTTDTTTVTSTTVEVTEDLSRLEDQLEEDARTSEDLPTAEALIGELNETSIDALDLSVATAFEQALESDDHVTYVELTPTDEAALRIEDEILSTLTTDMDLPSRDSTVAANATESPLNKTTIQPTPSTETTSSTVAATSVVTTATTTSSTTTTTPTTKTTQSTTTTTTPATTTTKTSKKTTTKPVTVRTKKPQIAAEGDSRTPQPNRQGGLPSLPVPTGPKEQSQLYIPAYGANACETKEEVFAPFWVNSTKGKVYAAMNIYPYEQFIHYEKCTNEHSQMFCREGCRCEQQYSLHRLLVFDVLNECRGIFSDWFRMPSSCVCKCYFHPGDPRSVSSRRPRIYEETREQRLRRKAAEAYATVRKFTEEAELSGKFDNTDYDSDLESDIFHSKMELSDEVDRKPVQVDPLVLDSARSARKMSLGEKSSTVDGATSTPELTSSSTTETSTTTSTKQETSKTAKIHRFAVKQQKEIQPSLSVKKQLKTEMFDLPINFAEEKIPRRPILEVAKDNQKLKFKTARNFQINLNGGSEDGTYSVQWAKPVSEGAQILKNPR